MTDDTENLKEKIVESLLSQGFYVNGHVLPGDFNKNAIKQIHDISKLEQIELQKNFIENNFNIVSKYFLDMDSFNPNNIELELREVKSGSVESIIYRWWNLVWWSVPYQKSYGRQMRFLLWDKTHNAPFGLIGLQSPILKMAVRDKFLNIPKSDLDFWINKSLQAQRLGALPPYNNLIGGKMTALALTSNELRAAYFNKYVDSKTVIKERIIESDLLFITTTSAFGRSSIYNRLNYKGEKVAYNLGYTKGSGTFHVPQNIYVDIQELLKFNGVNVKTGFGNGPSRKVKLLERAFSILNLKQYHYHNIQREFFFFPIAENYNDVIKNNSRPLYFDRPLDDLFRFWHQRWCLKRAKSNDEWKDFNYSNFLQTIQNNYNLSL